MKLINKILIILIILFSISACSGLKESLSLKKKQGVDEFLIEKKNPLVLPPDYGKLPEPNYSELKDKKKETNEIELLLNNGVENNSNNSNKKSTVEEIILKEIKTE